MPDPHRLLRNPRSYTPPSQRIGLAKWRRLPVEGQGQPLQPPPMAQRGTTMVLMIIAAYFIFRMLP